jgi:hypothetical protein
VSGRVGRVLLFVAVAAVVFGITFAVVRGNDDRVAVGGLAAPGDEPFAERDVVDGAFAGALSPSGNRLAVLTEEGLGLVERSRVVPISERGSRVVDVAWFPNNATVLVAEGPTPTGLLAVVDVDGGGKVRGSIRLDPSVGFGGGHGMSVAPGGRAAVVTAVERLALGAEQHHLVLVDLETGATRPLTEPGGPDEERPVHLGEQRVAFVERVGDTVRTKVVDVASGTTEDVAEGTALAGEAEGVPVVVDPKGRLLAAARQVGSVPAGATVVGLDVPGRQAIVVESTAGGTRLRRIALD